MRPAKTTIVFFFSDIGTSILGFLLTLYFARELGADVLGVYFVSLALVTWVAVPANGIGVAINKRVSENSNTESGGKFLTAGFLLNGLLGFIIFVLFVLFGSALDQHLGTSASLPVAALFIANIFYMTAEQGLRGQQLVELAGLMKVADRLVRAITQLGLVVWLDYGSIGLIIGHALGLLAVGIGSIGVFYQQRPAISLPQKEVFYSLLRFARYSWLGNLRSRTFGWLDTLVLSFFVSTGFIGIYEIAWRLASVLVLISNAIQSTLFPEISNTATRNDLEGVKKFLNEALHYAGIFTIPGFFGALVIGDKLLRIYGADFTKGTIILLILIAARLIDAYGRQMLNGISALDRPDITFRVNGLFVVSNFLLNVILVSTIGWMGAAIATFLSGLLMLMTSVVALHAIVSLPSIPFSGIIQQVLAALLMALIIAGIRFAIDFSNMYITIGMIGLGAIVYALALTFISDRVKQKAKSLIPARLVN